MEFSQVLRLARKWIWLVLVAAFVAGGVAFILNTGRPSVYTASSTVALSNVTQTADIDTSRISSGILAAPSYIRILQTFDLLQSTVDTLGITNISPDRLRSIMNARLIEGTTFITISVTLTDPVQAADLANELARQLVARSPGLSFAEQDRLDYANEQVVILNNELRDARERQALIENQIQNTQDTALRDNLQAQRTALITQITQTTASITAFTNQIIQLEQRAGRVDILEPARIPTGASGTNLFSITAIGAMLGAALAVGVALMVEYFDDTIRTSEQAAQVMALPILGAIVRVGKRRDGYQERLVINQPSMSPVAEGYRTLRTNLLYASKNSGKGVYIITSSNPEEGKSLTTANLAITMALAGLQVLLIDADLRRPKAHEVFGLENNVGLTTLLFADPDQADPASISKDGALPATLRQCLQNTSVPRLRVITSGFIPSNPTEILGSALMQRWIDMFRNSPNIDVVLIDTPPCLMTADSAVLAATTNADVVLVIDSARTRRGAALKAKEKFAQLDITLKGVILNRVNPRDETYEYGYYGYYYTPVKKGSGKDNRNGATKRNKQAEVVDQPEGSKRA